MKHTRSILICCLMVIAMPLAWTGCVGYVGARGGGYYGGGDVWVHDDVWVDGGGRGWYGRHDGAGYVHPSGGGGHPAPSHAASGGGHESGGGHAGGERK